MLTELTVTYKEMEMLVDALANLRRSEGEMRQMAHSVKDISDLRARIRRAMADHPQEWNPNYREVKQMNHRVGDWMKLNTGDLVREHDGRHIGRVEQIEHGAFVWVRWLESGHLSRFRLNEVVRVRADE